jgi:uncharacterized protein HemX
MLNSKNYNGVLKVSLILAVALFIGTSTAIVIHAQADQSTQKKLKNDAEDAKKNVRKGTRKAKKKVRDNSGHGSVKKDIQDQGADIKDDVSTEYNKMTN